MTKSRKTPGGRIALANRKQVVSLHRFLRDLARGAGRGEALAAQREFATRCGTSFQYLTQIALGIRRARPSMALSIEKGSYGLVKAEDVCPSFDWLYAKVRAMPRTEPRDRPTAESTSSDSTALAA